jgi:restriction endonuclease Mrr
MLGEQYNLTAEQSATLAIQNQRMNQGIRELVDNGKEWIEILEDTSNIGSADYAKALSSMAKVVRNLTGVSEDWEIPAEVMIDNLDLIKKAADGDTKAIARLGVAIAKNQLNNLKAVDNKRLKKAF